MGEEKRPLLWHGEWADEIEAKPLKWIWPNRIPAAKLTLIDGEPNIGKTTLLSDLAARVSTGRPWPDGTPCSKGRVLFYTSEDDAADTIKPRLVAAGADLSCVVVVPPVVLNEWKIKVQPPFALPGDVKILYDELGKLQTVKLVILDPFEEFLEDKLTPRGVRNAVSALATVARTTGVAIVLVRHLVKAGRPSPINAGLGSKAIIGQARAAYLVAPLPSDKEVRVLAPVKANVTKRPSSIAYRLVDVPDAKAPRVEWQGEVDITAEELLRPPRRSSPRRDIATDFLKQFLSNGPKPVQEVKLAATKQGIAPKTLRTACEDLMVYPDKQGFEGPWLWKLPSADIAVLDDGQGRGSDLPTKQTGKIVRVATPNLAMPQMGKMATVARPVRRGFSFRSSGRITRQTKNSTAAPRALKKAAAVAAAGGWWITSIGPNVPAVKMFRFDLSRAAQGGARRTRGSARFWASFLRNRITGR